MQEKTNRAAPQLYIALRTVGTVQR